MTTTTTGTSPVEVGHTVSGRLVTDIIWSDAIGRSGYSIRFDDGHADVFVGWDSPTVTNGILDGTYVNDGRGSGADRLDWCR